MPGVLPGSIRWERDEVLVPCRCTTGGPSPAVHDMDAAPRRALDEPSLRAGSVAASCRYTSSIAGVCRGCGPASWMVLMRPTIRPTALTVALVLHSEPPVGDWDGGLARVPRLLLLHQGHRAPRRPMEPAHRAPARGVRTAGLQRARPFVCPGRISRSVLTERLRRLETLGLVSRDGSTGYRLTTVGAGLMPVLSSLQRLGRDVADGIVRPDHHADYVYRRRLSLIVRRNSRLEAPSFCAAY